MPKDTEYTSMQPNAEGYFPYSAEDDAVWSQLFARQMAFLPGKVAPEYLEGVTKLKLNALNTPQVKDIDTKLRALTGAGAQGVPAIIPPSQFYALLSERKFPVATFLRRREHMDYIEEPDLFHEVFGHCPMLTNAAYADFIEGFGKAAQELGKGYSWHMFRLFWFTVEFGMIRTPEGLRAYGAGIVSSPAEAAHATSGKAAMQDFNLATIFRTPYRIDILQPTYFVIDSFEQLADTLTADFKTHIDAAKAKGDLPALFESKQAV
jgi:phenylalanine-4-hydroxylase